MWREIVRFSITKDAHLVVLLECDDKCDPFDRFDYVMVVFENNLLCAIISEDSLQESFLKLRNYLVSALALKDALSEEIAAGSVGYYFNIDCYQDPSSKNDLINYFDIGLFSRRDVQTWVYNYNDKIYLEIIPSYRWLFSTPPQDGEYEPFEDFMKTYQPIAVYIISSQQARAWISICDQILWDVNEEIEELFLREEDFE